MATCPECSTDLGIEAKFCQECGAKVGTERTEQLGANQQYCPSCGEIISAEAVACPSCGYDLDDGIDDKVWIAGGIVSLVIGAVLFAIIFAPLAMVIGFKLYSERDDLVGPLFIFLGLIEFLGWGIWWLSTMGVY